MKKLIYLFIGLAALASCGDSGGETPVEPDFVYEGPGGDFYNNDVVSTPKKEVKFTATRYLSKIDTTYYPESFAYYIGCYIPEGDTSSVTWKFTPANKSFFKPGFSKKWDAQKQKWGAAHSLTFYWPVTEEFFLGSTTTIKNSGVSVDRSSKIIFNVEQREVDVLHSKFGMSRAEVTKAEKTDMGLGVTEFHEISPEWSLKQGAFYSYGKYTAFRFVDGKLSSIFEVNLGATDLSGYDASARKMGYTGPEITTSPVTWIKNKIQITVKNEMVMTTTGISLQPIMKFEPSI